MHSASCCLLLIVPFFQCTLTHKIHKKASVFIEKSKVWKMSTGSGLLMMMVLMLRVLNSLYES